MKPTFNFNPKTGGEFRTDNCTVWFIPWENDNGKFFLWDITVRQSGSMQVIHTEVFCKDIPIIKMYDIAIFLAHHSGITPDEVKRYIRHLIRFKRINVYKMVVAESSGVCTYILETSKMAGTPVLNYPGTRNDEID